jgi:hypothetical protein
VRLFNERGRKYFALSFGEMGIKKIQEEITSDFPICVYLAKTRIVFDDRGCKCTRFCLNAGQFLKI